MTRPSRTGGNTREAKARNASPAKGRKTAKTKRRIAPAATRVKRRSVSGPSKDLKEAREQQAATAEILKVIASSPSDVQPVFEAIASNANRLIGAYSTAVHRVIDDINHLVAFTPTNPESDEVLKAAFPRHRSELPPVAWVENGETAQIADAETADAQIRQLGRARGWRSVTFTPLMSKGTLIGYIACTRRETGVLADHHVQLLQTFADQAVIAIENVRLFNEVQAKTRDLSEALTYQTGSSNILSVIASSPIDVEPVLKAIVESACELCEAYDAVVLLKVGDNLRISAHQGSIPIPIGLQNWPINRDWVTGRAVVDKVPMHVHDLLSPEGDQFPQTRETLQQQGHRTVLSVPMLREGESIGAIVLRRLEVQPFSEKQIVLLQTFANQAVIAIGNVRMFEQVQTKTRDLAESLEQQTATSEVLEVISASTGDLAPVFEKMLENATRVCGAEFGSMTLIEDGALRQAALYNPPLALAEARAANTFLRPHPQSALATAIHTKQVVHVADLRTIPSYLERARATVEFVELGGARTTVVVPMLRDDGVIGAITIYRQEVRPFEDKQIELVSNFAKQAVIAIENTRLLKELRQRTNDLGESLQQQTATGDVLKVIASSPTNVEPALQAIVESACAFCGAYDAAVVLKIGDDLHFSAHHGPIQPGQQPRPINRQWVTGRSVVDKVPVQVSDFRAPEAAEFPEGQRQSREQGQRCTLSVPLLREGEAIGAIVLRRLEPVAFSDKQVALLQTFADQAVIAIGNVRLFEEVQQRTRELSESLQFQTASSDVLKVISSSPDALQPVLDAIVQTSRELCESDASTIFLLRNGKFHYAAVSGDVPKHLQYLRDNPASIDEPLFGRLVREKRTLHFANVMDDPELSRSQRTLLGGPRALLVAPLLRDGEVLGAIVLRQSHLKPFTSRQVQAIEVFADQAVIAISNVELFEQVQERTKELSLSLEDLRTAQDRLVQTEKLASLGQLTAGIAHEIKNPLNFVNNFSALSAELTDELNDVLKPVTMDGKVRGEVDELTGLLKDNLEKVVQHGKRADSIVKNMLLHSREGSGERRPADINSLLDESLNLAYHGARAEKGEFNVTLQRDFDTDAGAIELFPQEITRAFLNLIANGVYAATKRKVEGKEPGFEPTLRATTKNLGTAVEIRIRDNGAGIPAEVQEKMFNPFFTTKPAGEGTGLGLSMTHDIVVKQHGGRIDVATEPGQFTEFTIVLPRKSNLSGMDRGKP